jgi:hypothetical protein
MASFDFITDEDFKTSLEKDFKEMSLCIQTGAYKAAVVIAGSIIEAILIDYVIAENVLEREDALKLDFGRVLTLCKDKKIISEKTSDLSSVIKGYRNLIHPGRAVRLNENVDKDSAEVSKALVNIVLGEVEKLKKENYGYTAEQIIAKIRNDSNASSILDILIKKTNSKELERLMLKHLPNAYLEETRLEDDPWGASPERQYVTPTLIMCFRKSFSCASDKLKKKVAAWFAQIIREEGDIVISSYGTAFFGAMYMDLMDPEDAELVKHHILGQMKNNMSNLILENLYGFGPFLTKSDAEAFIDPLVRYVCRDNDEFNDEKSVKSFLEFETSFENFDLDLKKSLRKRLDQWENTFTSRGQGEKAEKVKKLKDSVIDIPF